MHLLMTGTKKWQSYLLYYPTAGMVLSVQTASTSLFWKPNKDPKRQNMTIINGKNHYKERREAHQIHSNKVNKLLNA